MLRPDRENPERYGGNEGVKMFSLKNSRVFFVLHRPPPIILQGKPHNKLKGITSKMAGLPFNFVRFGQGLP